MFRLKGHVAGSITLALSIAVAIFAFQMPVDMAFAAAGYGFFNSEAACCNKFGERGDAGLALTTEAPLLRGNAAAPEPDTSARS